MNLPVILDVSLGLIFIYLILSLLASEIQELLATVFQWRAEHLRKSIELFIAGSSQNSEEANVLQLANQVYSNPLIKSLNQQAKGFLANIPRKATWSVANAYRSLKQTSEANTRTETVFGDSRRSGPSYIPASVFATTLMETLQLPTIAQKLTETRLDTFKNQRLSEIENVVLKLQEQLGDNEAFTDFFNFAYQAFAEIQADFEQVIWNFQKGKLDIDGGIQNMTASFDRYIESFKLNMPNDESTNKALQQLEFYKNSSFADTQQTISLAGLKPNVREIAQAVQRGSDIYQELTTSLLDKDSEMHQNLEKLIDRLPPSLANNITDLAQRAELNLRNTTEGVSGLHEAIANNFDNSMERASGVYKRNAKGVALLLGFAIAAASNADAFHMIGRLSKDSALRETIVQNAGQIVSQNRNQLNYVDINTLRSQTDEALNEIALPIGWTDSNLEKQIFWSQKQQKNFPIWRIITLIPGWFLSGIAIAMGAPFWFDLLGKVVNVRNAGKPPASSARNDEL
ncbi:MAG: hypothetical protein HC903_12320 [Methylacidiphilales bacterium]|nr:hypothetical protein [Candidatus Methylacidiphilales bacterium]